MKILVVGGAGYIGSHICKALFQKGYTPITLDTLSLGSEWAVKWGPLIVGSCGDRTVLDPLFRSHEIQGVIHLAALSNVRESEEIPLKYYQNNVGETLTLLDYVKKLPFVFSSTCAVYGMPETLPIPETHRARPISPYGRSKLMVEEILKESCDTVSILRYFNAAGADPDGEIGEYHMPESHLIPLLIQTALGERETFILNGNTHDTPDGTPVRDYIHVSDLAEAHVLALKAQRSMTLNLGTGKGYSVQEIIERIKAKSGAPLSIHLGPKRKGDPPMLVADAQSAEKTLGWKPKLSDLETIIETAWNWHAEKALI